MSRVVVWVALLLSVTVSSMLRVSFEEGVGAVKLAWALLLLRMLMP